MDLSNPNLTDPMTGKPINAPSADAPAAVAVEPDQPAAADSAPAATPTVDVVPVVQPAVADRPAEPAADAAATEESVTAAEPAA